MANVALGGWLIVFAVCLGWRGFLQWRRTGDHGFRGFRTLQWSPALLAGWGLGAGAVVSILAPVLVLAGVIHATPPLASPAIAALGLGLLALGLGVTVKAQLDMGDSWRVGVDRRERTALATHGLYRYTRNPIYTGLLLVWIAEALLVPNALSVVGVLLLVGAMEAIVRGIEEPYLISAHGDDYRAYARSVGRFFPGLGRLA
jgi:protein-S-isoprenylcysteine O-methyltransferase Ste14